MWRSGSKSARQKHKKGEQEQFENRDPHMSVDVECERKVWTHVSNITENEKFTSVPDSSDVRKVCCHVFLY